jgi:hypothetical protein
MDISSLYEPESETCHEHYCCQILLEFDMGFIHAGMNALCFLLLL